ncbi:MAG: PSD1 and planctomycete cytochrome C domain-containing protein [Planctomycetota bacterium]
MRGLAASLLVASSALTGQDPLTVVEQRCVSCHNATRRRAGLDLTTRDAALRGGKSGPALRPGDPEASLVLALVEHRQAPHMPHRQAALAAAEVDSLRAWIADGAPYARVIDAPARGASDELQVTDADRSFWAFAAFEAASPPAAGEGRAHTEADRFWLARLDAAGVQPNPSADKPTLLRRLCFTLLGLPPTRAQLDEFLADDRPDAYERAVDTLLASPHFGERQARHWLDVARYADSGGYEFDHERPHAYPYRDFVIEAMNDDMPFDEFVRLQVAADELRPDEPRTWRATGFLCAGPTVGNQENEHTRYDEYDDVVSTIGSAFLSLTVGCARCHDHKYDPIPTRDYYRLVAAFTTTERADRPLRTAPETPAHDDDLALVMTDRGATPSPSYLLRRGNPDDKVEPLAPGFLQVLTPIAEQARYAAPTPRSDTTGRRAALARWLTDVEHGAGRLLARVIVNRIWQQHMGRGLVATPNDFGMQGERPTDPALLDWLARDFIAGGFRLKRLHRSIVTSAFYRQTSSVRQGSTIDDGLWARRFPVRLDAESLRDAILATTGSLNPKLYGPSVKPWMHPDAIATGSTNKWPLGVHDGPRTWRRSLYVFMRRSVRFPLLEVFDAPDATTSCGRRTPTTTPLQALALMNDAFVRDQAEILATRVRTAAGEDDGEQVARAFEMALRRAPSADENERACRFLLAQRARHAHPDLALVDLCQILFNLNEFLYVD